MRERWLPVVGYEGTYEVSDLGRVRSLDRVDAAGQNLKGRILKPSPKSSGHLLVTLCNGNRRMSPVHRLVMEAFVGPCPEGREVCHYPDHDKTNNRLDNLMYGTRSENKLQSAESGLNTKRVRRSDGREFISASEASRRTNISVGRISEACTGKQKTAGGFKWEYI